MNDRNNDYHPGSRCPRCGRPGSICACTAEDYDEFYNRTESDHFAGVGNMVCYDLPTIQQHHCNLMLDNRPLWERRAWAKQCPRVCVNKVLFATLAVNSPQDDLYEGVPAHIEAWEMEAAND